MHLKPVGEMVETVREALPVKPFTGTTVTTVELENPTGKLRENWVAVMVKSSI